MEIVLATDFSGASMVALEWAKDFAKRLDAGLTLCHVLDTIELTRGVSVGGEEARGELEKLAQRVERELGRPVAREMLEGRPAHVRIVEFASAKGALLVMGTVGRTGLQRILVGSVAEAVVRQAKCPVLLIPPS